MQDPVETPDYYEILQISKNADADTIHRVYRLLAQRFHPDNQDTGDEQRFREIHEAYLVLKEPDKRAQYDVHYEARRHERWRLIVSGPPDYRGIASERHLRYVVLELLYSQRRTEADKPSLSNRDVAELLGKPREHLEFTIWYLIQKRLLSRDDQSRLTITVDGVDYVEAYQQAKAPRLRLSETRTSA